MDILKISHVKKSFGKNEILKDLNFTVPEHTIFGFVGQNGAGKTTTMKMILGLLPSDNGEIYVNDEPVVFGQNHTNRYIGYLPDVPEFYGFMTPSEYLNMCGEITGMSKADIRYRTEELLSQVGLDKANKRIKGFSRGMKQRLGIAQALFNSPKLLICDEPTSALDPVGRREILDILQSVKGQTTVLFSTHILSDVERICDRVAFLHEGQIALSGTIDDLKTVRKGSTMELEFSCPEETKRFAEIYCSQKNNETCRIIENKIFLPQKTEKDIMELLELIVKNNVSIKRVERLEPTLEDLFMEVMAK